MGGRGVSGDVMEVRDAVAGYKVPVVEPEVPAGYKRTEVGVIPEDWLARISHHPSRNRPLFVA